MYEFFCVHVCMYVFVYVLCSVWGYVGGCVGVGMCNLTSIFKMLY